MSGCRPAVVVVSWCGRREKATTTDAEGGKADERCCRYEYSGDIFERDNLDWQSRELATVGALASTPGVEPQLVSHMAAAMRVGLTGAQLRQLTHFLAARGEADAAKRADEALTQALAASAVTR